jgi:hypothetical protein
MRYEYKTIPYFKKGKGPRAWDDFLCKQGYLGWGLVFTQELPTRRNCTFMKALEWGK